MAEVVEAERAMVCIPVSTSNSVLAVPPAKPGTTTWPLRAWGSRRRAWRLGRGSFSSVYGKAGASVMSENASFITMITLTSFPSPVRSPVSHSSAPARLKPSGRSTR